MPAIWFPHGVGPEHDVEFRSWDPRLKNFRGRAIDFVPARAHVVVEVDGQFKAVPATPENIAREVKAFPSIVSKSEKPKQSNTPISKIAS